MDANAKDSTIALRERCSGKLIIKITAYNILKYFPFLIFPRNGFDISCKLSPLSSPIFWKNKKNMTNLLSDELAHRVVKVKSHIKPAI